MKNIDFIQLLKQLPFAEPEPSQRTMSSVLGVQVAVVNKLLNEPDTATQEYVVRHVRFMHMLPPKLQQYLVSKRIEAKTPNEELVAFARLEDLHKRVSEIGMSKLAFNAMLGIDNSTYRNAERKGVVPNYIANLLEVFTFFDQGLLAKLVVEYEFSERALKKIEANLESLGINKNEGSSNEK